MHKKKRKYETGRVPANTKLVSTGTKRIRIVRARGGNTKFRALRLDSGNFSWGSEGKRGFRCVLAVLQCVVQRIIEEHQLCYGKQLRDWISRGGVMRGIELCVA